MPDDPREVLRAAGVECAEVDAYFHAPVGNIRAGAIGQVIDMVGHDEADAAILAVSRIASQLASDKSDCQEAAQRANEAASLANQDNERLRGEVAKYKWQRDATVGIAGYNEEEAQELLDEVDLEWHEEERRRQK